MQIKQFSIVDRLWMLWVICCIDHYTKTNNRKMLARYYMQQEFGEDVTNYFEWTTEWLAPYGLIDTDRMTLTPRGQYAADNWQDVKSTLSELSYPTR